jgi:hypothetical protein
MNKEEVEELRLWLFIEDRLAEDEAARIEALSEEDLVAEKRAAGHDPRDIITFDEVLARIRAEDGGAGGAAPVPGVGEGREGPGEAALFSGAGIVRAVPASAVSESSMETRRLPTARSRAPKAEEAERAAKTSAGTHRVLWLLAACFLLALGAVGYVERGAIVARLQKTPVDIGPAPEPLPIPPVPAPSVPAQLTPAEESARDRETAQAECSAGQWVKCQYWIDRAFQLDPLGTFQDEKVKAMRKEIVKHLGNDPKGMNRPQPQP